MITCRKLNFIVLTIFFRVFVKVVKILGLLYTISIFEFVRQLNCMELVWFRIVLSGDMKVICR